MNDNSASLGATGCILWYENNWAQIKNGDIRLSYGSINN
jgi:hypothetical protein